MKNYGLCRILILNYLTLNTVLIISGKKYFKNLWIIALWSYGYRIMALAQGKVIKKSKEKSNKGLYIKVF